MHGWRSSCSPLHGWVLLLLLKQRINLILSFCEHFQFFKTLLRTHVTVRSNPRTVLKRSWLWRGDIVCCLSWNRCHSAWLQMWQLQYVFPRWWKCPPGTWISLRLHSVTKAVSLFFSISPCYHVVVCFSSSGTSYRRRSQAVADKEMKNTRICWDEMEWVEKVISL